MRKSVILAAMMAAAAFPALAQLTDTPPSAEAPPSADVAANVAADVSADPSADVSDRGERRAARAAMRQSQAQLQPQSQSQSESQSESQPRNGVEQQTWRGRRGGGGEDTGIDDREAMRAERQARQQQQQVAPAAPVFAPAPQPVAEPARPQFERTEGLNDRWQANRVDRDQRRGAMRTPDFEQQRWPSTIEDGQRRTDSPVLIEQRRADGERSNEWRYQRGFENRADRDEDRGGLRSDRRDWRDYGRRNDAYRGDDRGFRNDTQSQWNRGYGWQTQRGFTPNWNRDWRRDQRYDWQRYRYSNRDLFQGQRYYAPFGWSYGYRRFSIGFSLTSVLFDRQYWIDDPYNYRLPPAYGAYRWVRYYEDVLLVDLRTGQVVDAIYGFFD